MLNADSVWGAGHDYWTDDDDENDTVKNSHNSESDEDDDNVNEQQDWLKEFEAKRKELDDVLEENKNFVSNKDLLEPAVRIPEPTDTDDNKNGRFIRKHWAVTDCRPVDDFDEMFPRENRAILHPFELDGFQKRAIFHIEHNEHVFVCAHTSAGKTVVAEYAIASAAKHKMRAIYTSPIKALSNQKYREFCALFGEDSVGIITGDVSVNTNAQCLIMTTEILRNLLYRGDGLISQVAVVIYDEVHYVNDPERGVVWEETIIMLPSNITMVMLSATVPNHVHFADWIGVTKQREVFVISTTTRPTPLQHFLWSNDKPYLLMDSKGKFDNTAYNRLYTDNKANQRAKETKAQGGNNNAVNRGRGGARGGGGRGGSSRGGGGGGGMNRASGMQSADAKRKAEKQKLVKLLDYLQKSDGLPVVCFCFSRKKCESLAEGMPNFLDVSSDTKSKCHVFIRQAISNLSEDDKSLPQIRFMENLVARGIGVHHGGLLPIVKEIVEILFSKGLVQVLFATETFAMGVNMPARSVILTSIYKHDGRRNRTLYSSEYTQMAGRAGRRGLDTCGNVYIFSPDDEPPDHLDLSSMMLHKANPLLSKFRLTFSMLLQLFSRKGVRPLEMVARSFKESLRAQQLPILKRDLVRKQKQLETLPDIQCIFGEPDIENYANLDSKTRNLGLQLHQTLAESKFASEVFTKGRIVLLHSLPFTSSTCYGTIIRSEEITTQNPHSFAILILIPRGCTADLEQLKITSDLQNSIGSSRIEVFGGIDTNYESTVSSIWDDIQAGIDAGAGNYVRSKAFLVMRNIPIDQIVALMTPIVPLGKENDVSELQDDDKSQLTTHDDQLKWTRCAQLFDETLSSNWLTMTPFSIPKKMKFIEIEHMMVNNELKQVTQALSHNKCHMCPKKERNITIQRAKCELLNDISNIQFQISDASLDLLPDLNAKIKFLKGRGFIQENGAISLKGRAACEILATDELTLVEAIFEHVFQDKSIPAIAAIVSAFVFPEKSEDESVIFSEEVEIARLRIEALHDELGNEIASHGIRFEFEDWKKICNFQFAPIAFLWARGEPFTKLIEKTALQEGTIVRTIVRLDELIRKIKNVAHLIGDVDLKSAMEKTSEAIHRDIVFAASLYIK